MFLRAKATSSFPLDIMRCTTPKEMNLKQIINTNPLHSRANDGNFRLEYTSVRAHRILLVLKWVGLTKAEVHLRLCDSKHTVLKALTLHHQFVLYYIYEFRRSVTKQISNYAIQL